MTWRNLPTITWHQGMTFTGLQGMMDPPRPESIEAINGCKKAGIRTIIMITGGHAVTAVSIAKKLGLGSENHEVITGKELETKSDGYSLTISARLRLIKG